MGVRAKNLKDTGVCVFFFWGGGGNNFGLI